MYVIKYLLFWFIDYSNFLSSVMLAWLQVRKETWVPLDLQDLLEDREPQEDLVLLDLKVLTHSILTTKIMYDNTYCFKLTYAE